MQLNIINNSFDIVLTLSLGQVSREHSEPDQHVFLLYIPQSRETALLAEPCNIFSATRANFGAPELHVRKDIKKFELQIWIREVIKIKLSEGNFLTLKFTVGVISNDVTI